MFKLKGSETAHNARLFVSLGTDDGRHICGVPRALLCPHLISDISLLTSLSLRANHSPDFFFFAFHFCFFFKCYYVRVYP